MGGMMTTRVKLADGSAYQLDEFAAEEVGKELDDESGFIEFVFENAEVRVYKQYIVSVEWRWEE